MSSPVEILKTSVMVVRQVALTVGSRVRLDPGPGPGYEGASSDHLSRISVAQWSPLMLVLDDRLDW